MAATLKLRLTPVSQDTAANQTRVRVRVTITTSDGTFNESGSTSGSITLDGVKIASLKGKKVYINQTTTLYDKEHDVTHKPDGRKTVTASASFDVDTSVRWISAAAELELQRIPRASELVFADMVLGEANEITITRAVETYEDEIHFTLGEASGTVTARTAETQLQWTPPVELAAQAPKSAAALGSLTVTTYNGEEVVGTRFYFLTYRVTDRLKPTASAELTDENGWFDKYGAYVQNNSRLTVAALGTGTYGSTITGYRINIDGAAYEMQQATVDLPNAGAALPVKVQVLDSRGRWSEEFSTTINVLDYKPPTVTSLSAGRCDLKGAAQADGEYMSLVFSADITSLRGFNSATYYARYRIVGEDEQWHSVLLPELSDVHSPRDAGAIIAADTTKAYEVSITAADDFKSVPSKLAMVPIAFVFFQFDAKTRSWAFFQKAVEPDTFRIAEGMAVRLPVDTHIGDKSWLDRTYPIGSLYLTVSDANPADLFGGTWRQIKDTFLLAAGDTYALGSTGGETEHTLTVDELPNVEGTAEFRAWGSGSPITATSGAFSRKATENTALGFGTADSENATRQLSLSFGGDQPHNNMPPYLAVNVWQRIADPADSGLTVTDDGAGNITIL